MPKNKKKGKRPTKQEQRLNQLIYDQQKDCRNDRLLTRKRDPETKTSRYKDDLPEVKWPTR